MNKNELDHGNVLGILRERGSRALHLGEICSRLQVAPDERASVLEVLDALVEKGLVKELPGKRFRASKSTAKPANSSEIRGRFVMNPRGFGFVATEDTGPDVFIPPDQVGAAMHGDLVLIRARPSPKGRDGAIVGIVERGLKQVTGVLQHTQRARLLHADDPRMRSPMSVVGDLPDGVNDRVEVVAEITRYPKTRDDAPEVRVLRVLGAAGVARVEVEKIKIREGITEEFPDDVLREAQSIPAEVPEADKEGREDLRHLDLVTIDPDDARDHDDALWAERLSDGGYRVVIAIADVSHYVREGTAIDREALARGCSIYLPDRAIPMLPRELSSNLASLVPNQDRLTLAVEVELTSTGAIHKHRYIEGVMRSGARLTYGGAARALRLTDTVDTQHEAEVRQPLLSVLLEAAKLLRAKRTKRGSLDFDLPEPRVRLDPETGEPLDVIRSRKDPGVRQAYNLVEELMLLANEVVAADLAERGIPAIYRVHGAPDEEKVARFAELAVSLGYALDPDAGEKPKKLSQFLRRVEGTPHAQALGFLLLRAMQQAVYDTTNIGHFGLAARDYLHFTSPIRRYPDLAVHRIVRDVIHKRRFDGDSLRRKLQAQAMESSRLERRAMGVERDSLDLYRAILMRNRIGEEFDATITGVAGHGFYSSFDAPFVDALTKVEDLGDDFYELDDLGLRLVGRRNGAAFSLGDRVRLHLLDVSIMRRELVAVPLEHLPDDRSLYGDRSQPRRSKRPTEPLRKGTKPQNRRQATTAKPGKDSRKPGDRKPGDRKPGDRKPGDRKPGDRQKAGAPQASKNRGRQRPGSKPKTKGKRK